MSNESGGTPPERDPFAPPDDDSAPVDATRPLPPPPSGYEAVGPTAPLPPAPPSVGSTAPVPPSFEKPGQQPGAAPGQTPYPAPGPTPYGQAGQAGQSPYGAPASGAAGQPPYGAPYGQPPSGQAGQTPYGQAGQSPYGQPGQPYGQPGQAPYGQPPYGQPPYGTPGYGAPTPPTDGLAIASFATSTGGLVLTGGLVSPVGLGLGIAALRRIKRTGKGGRSWAIAGIVVGAVGTLTLLVVVGLLIALGIFAANSDDLTASLDRLGEEIEQDLATPDDLATPGEEDSDVLGYYVLRDDVAVGDCLESYPLQYDMGDATVVPCAEVHDTEIVAQVELDAAVLDEAASDAYESGLDACAAAIDVAAPGLLSTNGFPEIYYPHPDDFSTPGGSTAFCTFTADETNLTGSIVAGDVLVGGQAVGS